MSISRKPGAKSKTTALFNPSANYVWDENQEFVILGAEFNTILKSLQAAADTPEFKRNAAIYQGLSVINNIFKDAVEQDLIQEAGKEEATPAGAQSEDSKEPE